MRYRLTILTLLLLSITYAVHGQSSITGRDWSVVYLKGATVGTTAAHIQIDTQGKRFAGNTGCNIANGGIRMSRDRIRFSTVITTKRACTRETASIESAFLTALNKATSYKFAKERLRLYSGRTLLAEFGPRSVDIDKDGPLNASDQIAIEDRKWILESINGSTIPKVEQEASIVFDPEKGSAGGDTSCNSYGGEYKIDGNNISISGVISTMRACIEDERMKIERGFLDGIQQADRYEIKANKLMLYHRGKLLLTFEGRKK